MTRRITLTFLVLITALLTLAVVPLGVSMTANEYASFRFNARSSALEASSAAEEYLADRHGQGAMHVAVASVAGAGDCVAVYGAGGSVLDRTPCSVAADGDSRALFTRVLAGGGVVTAQDEKWLRVAVPIGDDGKVAGVVVYARSADPLDDRIAAMWGWLALIGVAGLVLGAGLAVRLARWVSLPLTALGAAAAGLGDGALHVRAPAGHGPPEVRRLALTFNRMAQRTEALVHGHQGWVADVSHQLRTPLTALRLRLDLLAQDVGEQAAAELAGAQEEIARLSRLVDGLLAVARAQGAVPRPEAVRVEQVAAERVAAWEPVARERRVGVSLAAPARASAQLGPGDLEQMLDNLLANALEAVVDGGRVLVQVAEAHGRVALRVVDDGPGMGPRAKEGAFRRFASSGAGGNGLGLAIVHRLATANGGGVRLADTPGGGLTVELDLPGTPRGAKYREPQGAPDAAPSV